MLPYAEGSVCLVPLRRGGYGRGVVARVGPKGRILFGYFFGPRFDLEDDIPLSDLLPANSILEARVGDLGFIEGSWKVIGKLPHWNRDDWRMPDFIRRAPEKGFRSVLVRYSDIDPACVELEKWIADDPSSPPQCLFGSGALEVTLTRLLESTPPADY